MLIQNDLLGVKHDKVQMAIERLQSFCPPEGYHVAFSGGKDSQCIYHLCKMAGIPFDAHYSVTSVDPPELVRFIKDHYPDVYRDIPHKDGLPITMWSLIPKKMIPPTRTIRYCCEVLKESNGKGRVVVTGVRWAESPRRAVTHGIASVNRTVLNDDNAETRRMVEQCYRTTKTLINPIVDWSDADVWSFLNKVIKVPHCELYDQGFKRLGCIGCPMSTHAGQELNRWPKYNAAYLRAFQRMLENREARGLETNAWTDAESVMRWWLSRRRRKNITGQVSMWEPNDKTEG